MIYGSVCSGIEAASVAWHSLGWRASFLSEIEAFPRAVLAHHYLDTPLHGDFTTIAAGQYDPIDLLVGGTPCQSFSIAGLRGGLDDDRGNLALEYLRLADRLRPRWLVWENVPGVLSSNGGRDFGAILGGMVELGYGFAYRVLDAQFFGVAQRRRRVFVVGYLGDWRRAAAVLFERHSLSGHPAPRREKGPSVAALTANGVGTCGADDNQGQAGHLIPDWPAQVSPTLNAAFGSKLGLDNQHIDSGAGMFVAHTLKGEGFDASEDGTGRGTPIVPVAYRTTGNDGAYETGEQIGALTTSTDPNAQIIAFSSKDHGADAMSDLSPTLRAGGHSKSHANAGVMPAVSMPLRSNYRNNSNPATEAAMHIHQGSAVRRLTPRECERLQGFPDDYTLIPYGKRISDDEKAELAAFFERTGQYIKDVDGALVFDREAFETAWPRIAADGPRYKALGNSMAVPVMAWIGRRIAAVDALQTLIHHREAA